jgi:hypothetical protein
MVPSGVPSMFPSMGKLLIGISQANGKTNLANNGRHLLFRRLIYFIVVCHSSFVDTLHGAEYG